MSRAPNSGSRPKLACEISADRVLAGRVSDNGGHTLEACASSELAPGSVVPDLIETNLRQPDAAYEAVRDVLGNIGGRSRDVIAVLPDAAVRVVLLDFEALPSKRDEVEGVVRFRLKKSLPFDVDKAKVSYHVQPSSTGVRVIAAVALALLTWRAFRPERPPMNRICRVDSRHAGTALHERRRAARAAFVPAAPGADSAVDGADAALEGYVRRWVTARVGACEDADANAGSDPVTHARFQQRMRCFDDLRGRTESAIAGAFRAPVEAGAAEAAIAALPLPETCLTH